ncbi:Locomotion-related protein Hikaru genki-like protein, partial [Leptotrombidium deliense]
MWHSLRFNLILRQYPSGWAVNEDERNWKYRVSIYYANELDSGEFKCVTPKGHYNSIKVTVKASNGMRCNIHTVLTFIDVECPAIVSSDVNRVMVIEGNKMHNKAKFSCVDGYYLEGIDEIVCTSSGYWSYEAPLCKGTNSSHYAIKCPTIKSDDLYLRITEYNRTYGSHVHYSCPNGYKLNGVSFMTCLKNNTWNAEVPSCE